MKVFIGSFFGALTVLLVWAAMAQAVSWDYCYSSLRGGGSLAPDNDVAIKASQFTRTVVATYHAYWLGNSGSYTVTEAVRFYFANGESTVRQFSCSGSGSSYSDWWTGY